MKILMVCLGNICRSPLAHGVMQDLIIQDGLDWQVDSAGTGDWHIGHAPDKRSIAVARDHGVDISTQRAQHLTVDLLEQYDHIFVMDKQNEKDVLKLARTPEQQSKVRLFLVDDVVPDPYFDDTLFEPVFQMIKARCYQLLTELKAS